MPQIREQIAMVHLPPSKTLKYLFHVRKTDLRSAICGRSFLFSTLISAAKGYQFLCSRMLSEDWTQNTQDSFYEFFIAASNPMVKNYFLASVG